MIDSVQLILLLVIIVLTVLLVTLGVQVFFILKEVRKTVGKANKVLESAGTISDNISGPIASLTSLISGLKAGSFLTLAKFVRTLLSKDSNERGK